MSNKRPREEWVSNFQKDLARSTAAHLFDLCVGGHLDMSQTDWEEAAVKYITPLKKEKVDGVEVEIRGGVTRFSAKGDGKDNE